MILNKLIPPSEITNAEYHKAVGISASTLKMCKINPDYYKLKHKLQSIDSIALDKGTCTHHAILESETFNWIDFNFNSKDEELLKVMINNSKVMFPELKTSLNEHSIFVKFKNVIKKARIDAIVKLYGNLYPSDYKTSKCSTPEEFKSESYKLDYDLQAAWNYDLLVESGYNPSGFIFYVQPSVFPYVPFKMECSPYFIESGREKYQEILERVLKGQDYYHNLDLPQWVLKGKGIIE